MPETKSLQRKEIRCTNIIIHGLQESSREEDQKFFKDLQMKHEMERTTVKAVQRIGKPDTNGPVKVELPTEQEKVTLLQKPTETKR